MEIFKTLHPAHPAHPVNPVIFHPLKSPSPSHVQPHRGIFKTPVLLLKSPIFNHQSDLNSPPYPPYFLLPILLHPQRIQQQMRSDRIDFCVELFGDGHFAAGMEEK